MANYGMATSARPPTAPWRMPQPAPPTPKAAPEAPKAAAVPEGSFALAPPPIKAMPPRPDTMSNDQILNYMAGAISQHLVAALMQDFPWLCLLPVVSLSDQPQKCMHWLLQSHHLQRHQQCLCLCQVIAQMRSKVKEAAEIKFAKQSVQSSWPV